MFSRLAARTSSLSRVATRSVAPMNRLAVPAFNRTFKTTAPVLNAAAPAAKAENPAEVIDKYGATTFWGMVAAIMISKEMFILDAEFLLSVEIAAFVMTGYVLTGDSIEKMSKEWDDKTTAKFNGANDFMLEMFNQYKMVQGVTQNKPAVLKQYHDEYKTAIEAHAAFMTVKPQHEARAQVLNALEAIKSKEEHALAMEWQNTVDAAVANIHKAFAADSKLQEEMLELSIKSLGFEKPQTTDANDPIKRLFMNEFKD